MHSRGVERRRIERIELDVLGKGEERIQCDEIDLRGKKEGCGIVCSMLWEKDRKNSGDGVVAGVGGKDLDDSESM